MSHVRTNGIAAALAEVRAAGVANRASSAALHRSAVTLHEDAHAAAAANVRRHLVALTDALAELWAVDLVRRRLTGETHPFEPSRSGEWQAKAILRAVPYSLGGRRLRGRVTSLAKRIAASMLVGLHPVERHYWSPTPAQSIRLRDAARRDKTFAEQFPERRYWVRRAAVAEAEFGKQAMGSFCSADAVAVMAVRRDLSGALVRYPARLPSGADPAKITEAQAATIWARASDLRNGAAALRHELKPSPEVRK